MNTPEDIEQQIKAAHQSAVGLLETQPKDARGCILTIASLGGDSGIGLAYGSPQAWAQMLIAVSENNQAVRDALVLCSIALQHNISAFDE